MKKMKSKLLGLVFGVLFMVGNANAITVFDPANLAQNTGQLLHMIASYKLQIDQYVQQINTNARELSGLQQLTDLKDTVRNIQKMDDALRQMDNSIRNGVRIEENLKAWYGTSSMTPAQYSKALQERNQAGEDRIKTLIEQYETNNKVIEESGKQLMLITESVKSINGPTEGAQAINASLAIMIKQNNSMLSMMQINTIDMAEKQAEKNNQIKWNQKKESDYKRRKQLLEAAGGSVNN